MSGPWGTGEGGEGERCENRGDGGVIMEWYGNIMHTCMLRNSSTVKPLGTQVNYFPLGGAPTDQTGDQSRSSISPGGTPSNLSLISFPRYEDSLVKILVSGDMYQ